MYVLTLCLGYLVLLKQSYQRDPNMDLCVCLQSPEVFNPMH